MRRPNGLAELGRSTMSLPSSAPTQRAQSVNPKAPRARENTRANLCDTTPLRGGSLDALFRDAVPAPGHQNGSFVGHKDDSISLYLTRPHDNDALSGVRSRLVLRQDLTFGIDGVPAKPGAPSPRSAQPTLAIAFWLTSATLML